ncbi:YciK family oxidoreductase [Paraglaciecola aquimarina]|uniref:YciK family oxidoreductase n=1 Tax=Paraglaciecola aquimarina TaxID=1235557 RepID=A0ABU3SYU1_9ALTE|nr:YciK family oxidoreductase [Paraglaciecola aquimarina]MDU0355173.1 YciK family oxidoreductase [Paraglaciecola aquimarina]
MLNYRANEDYLDKKIILITGAGDGIGKQAALEFAKYGATIILLGKTVKKLESVYDQIVNNGGNEPAIVPLDLKGATKQHYIDMGNTIIDQFGRLDGLVHNASFVGHLGPFGQMTEEDWHAVFQVNVHSQFLMTQGLLPALKKSAQASVIFTSSGLGVKGRAYWGAYSISKFATQGMMQVLADEYEHSSIRFNCINPGPTRTNMRAVAFPEEDPKQIKSPAEIMTPYLYLMDNVASQDNGQTLQAQ